MLRLNTNIAIQSQPSDTQLTTDFTQGQGLDFDFVHEVRMSSSWDIFTDTCQIIIPRKLRYKRNGNVIENVISGDDPLFKRGDLAKIVAGYGVDQIAERFRGYISNVSPRNPLVIDLQDAMYLLKQKTISKYSKRGVTLESLLSDIMPENIPFETTVEFEIGKFIIERATIAEVLEFLRKQYGIISYFRKGVLYSGVAYRLKGIDQVKLHDIDLDSVGINTDNLIYQRSDDQRIKVTGVSVYPDNTKKEVTVGDTDGGERTQYFYNVPESSLKTYAEEQLEKFKYTGFSGSFTTFLNPYIQHGDAVRLFSEKIPDAQGVYLVKSVETSTGVNGGRQEIELDIKI